ncbi:hypothetical protein PNOK_0802400 [Pyrrhoderma noxium]|uniref:Uncharacterized protein n=1 Tax=Pyrrhoderma noxium TaxID=2282107 RepID=A0A286UA73_9AGAM|nr:hypothetical protein PNOK_0802400 [Pyrrhoderma noxium]
MPALGFTSSPSEATPSSLPTQSTGRSPGLLIDMAILIAAILSFLSFLVYYNFKGSSGISSIFHTRICNGTKREGNDIEKCSQTDRIRKDIISQPNLLYGTGSLVLNDPDIGSSVIVTDMQESDLSLTNVQETSEGPKDPDVRHVGSEQQEAKNEEDQSKDEELQDTIDEEESNSSRVVKRDHMSSPHILSHESNIAVSNRDKTILVGGSGSESVDISSDALHSLRSIPDPEAGIYDESIINSARVKIAEKYKLFITGGENAYIKTKLSRSVPNTPVQDTELAPGSDKDGCALYLDNQRRVLRSSNSLQRTVPEPQTLNSTSLSSTPLHIYDLNQKPRHSHLLSSRQIKCKSSSQIRLAITDSQSSSPLLTETLKKRGPKFDNRSPEPLKTMRTTCIDDVLRIVSTPSSRDERLKAISLLTNKQPEPERGHNAKDGKECYIVPPTPAGSGFHGEENPGNDNKLDSTYTTNTEKNTKALGQGLGAPKTGVGATRWASSGPPSPSPFPEGQSELG